MPLQMAFDEVLFGIQKTKAREPFLRFYVSSEPWISTGYSFRDRTDHLKSSLILRNPRVPVCRRMTGGGCVLHGGDLIFSLIAPISESGTQRGLESVRASYKAIHEAVKTGLQSLGLGADFCDSEVPLPKGNDCFDFPVESDLSWRGKKFAGGAQKRSEGVLLHHESITMPSGVGRDALIGAIRAGLEQTLGVTIRNSDMDPEMYFQAERNALSREA